MHLGLDRLCVPVGTLDEPDGDLSSGALGPLDDPLGILIAASQVGLHGQPGGEVDFLAASLEEFEREVFERVVLHVEVDQHASLCCLLKNWAESVDETSH